jgi:hypothetical protein
MMEKVKMVPLRPGMTLPKSQLYKEVDEYTPMWNVLWKEVEPMILSQYRVRVISDQVSMFEPFRLTTLTRELAALSNRTLTNNLNADLAVLARMFMVALHGGITQFSEFVQSANLAEIYATLLPEAAEEAHKAVSVALRDELKPFLVQVLRSLVRNTELRTVSRNAQNALDHLRQSDLVDWTLDTAPALARELIEVYRAQRYAAANEIFLRLTSSLMDNTQSLTPILVAIAEAGDMATASIAVTGDDFLPLLHDLNLLRWVEWQPTISSIYLCDGTTQAAPSNPLRPIFYAVNLPQIAGVVDLPDLLQWVTTVAGVWAAYLPSAGVALIQRSLAELFNALERYQLKGTALELLYAPEALRQAPVGDRLFRLLLEVAYAKIIVHVLAGATATSAIGSYISQQIGMQQLTDTRRLDIAVGFAEALAGLPLYALSMYERVVESAKIVKVGDMRFVNTPQLLGEFRLIADRVTSVLKATLQTTSEATARLDAFEQRARELILTDRAAIQYDGLVSFDFYYSRDKLMRQTQTVLYEDTKTNTMQVYDYAFLSDIRDASKWSTLDANLDNVIRAIDQHASGRIVDVNGMFIRVIRVNFFTGSPVIDKLALLVPRYLPADDGVIDLEYIYPRIHDFKQSFYFANQDDVANFLGYASWEKMSLVLPEALMEVLQIASERLLLPGPDGRPQFWLMSKYPLIIMTFKKENHFLESEEAATLATCYTGKYKLWTISQPVAAHFHRLDGSASEVELSVPMIVPENVGLMYKHPLAEVVFQDLPETRLTFEMTGRTPLVALGGLHEIKRPSENVEDAGGDLGPVSEGGADAKDQAS